MQLAKATYQSNWRWYARQTMQRVHWKLVNKLVNKLYDVLKREMILSKSDAQNQMQSSKDSIQDSRACPMLTHRFA